MQIRMPARPRARTHVQTSRQAADGDTTVPLAAASIETLQERLDGLASDVRAAQQQSHSAEHAELRSIRSEYEEANGAAARAEKELREVEHQRAELQTELQQRQSTLRKLERQRQQLAEELEMGEASMRHAESGVHGKLDRGGRWTRWSPRNIGREVQ